MANGFGNRHDQMFNYNNTEQIRCRFCNRIFTSTLALVTHIEMEQEKVAIRRLYSPEHNNSQRQQLQPHRFPPGFSLSIETPTKSPIAISQPNPNGQIGSSESIRSMQFQPPFLSYAGNNNINNNVSGGLLAQFPSPQINQWKPDEESPSDDGTKAYIMQLEKPIIIKKNHFIDLVNNDDEQKLDLTLRL